MIKTLTAANHSERERFSIPRSVQQSIPIRRIYPDGIWQVGGKFSRTWRFADINYAVASHDDQTELFLAYCGVLNALPTDATTKITISNRRLNADDFRRTVLMRERDDLMDQYRREYNGILTGKAAESNNLVQEKYVTISVARRGVEEAHTFFNRVDNDLGKSFGKLDSGTRPLSSTDRLRILHDFFRPGDEQCFHFDLEETIRKGHDYRDYICPDGLKFKADHFEMGGKVGRVLFLREFASYIKDSMITELSDFSRNLMLSVDILPIPTDEAVKEMQSRILAIETDITRWQQKQNANNNFTAAVPYDLEQLRTEAKEFLDDLSTRDQRMMFGTVTLVHVADTLEQLDADTETLLSVGRKHLCQFAPLRYQQEDGLNTALPYGLRRIRAMRTLTTESTAVLMPFSVQEIQDKGGIYYGVNAISKNLLICNRKQLMNPHAFWLGVSGSGKSFAAKEEIVSVALSTDDDIILVDPEREYGNLVAALAPLGAQTVNISATSSNYINAMDMAEDYGDGKNPVVLKSEFVMSLCEQLMGAGQLSAKDKSIIDRCTANVYRTYMKRACKGQPPTLREFYNELKKQPEPEAQGIALSLELFTSGSLNVFAHQSNIDVNSRILNFDLYDLGENLKPLGLLVMLDSILNRVIRNRQKGRYTHIYIDEIYLFFTTEYSASFLYKCWKRFRKYGGIVTGITQNVEECLRSDTARLMLANSEFLMLFNQAATDRRELAKLLNISPTQMSYITNADAGHGLVKVGGSIVPFINEFPRDTELYRLMTTTPGEG
jgi:hypothetical protein